MCKKHWKQRKKEDKRDRKRNKEKYLIKKQENRE